MTPKHDVARLTRLVATQRKSVAFAKADGTLADWLYRHWYLTSDEEVALPDTLPPLDALDSALCDIVDSLSPWSDDWVVLALDALGGCIVGKGGKRREIGAGRHAGHGRPGLPPMPGDTVALPDLWSWRDTLTGQWAAQSCDAPSGDLVRVYVNVGPDGVGHAVRRIVTWLVANALPFRMKCPGSSDAFMRADALVLYLDRADWISHQAGIRVWAHELGMLTRAGRPAMTMPIAPGVSFAEDPGDGRSFGEHRCAIIADAIATLPGRAPPHQMTEAVARAITSAGISMEQPWRCAS